MFDLNTAKGLKRKRLTFICASCGRGFIPKDQWVMAKVSEGNQLEVTCTKCWEQFEKDWWPVEASFTSQNQQPYVTVKFRNGQVIHNIKYIVTPDTYLTPDIELPEATCKELKRQGVLYYADVKAKTIADFKIIDGYDEQSIYCKTHGGQEYRLNFKLNLDKEIMLDPKVTPEIPPHIMQQIGKKLNDQYQYKLA
jgi:hypothetical protein